LLGALAGVVLALLLGGLPFALLANAERRKAQRNGETLEP
jgi:hypothetical protein